jgi:lysophospholipase L1-like esterase
VADDKKHGAGKVEKTKKLIIEWTGANDLITINDKPTYEAADIAVHERIKNIKKLAKEGYQNFLLMNLPDLALTPRYCAENNTDDPERTKNARKVTEYFNDKLKEEVMDLQRQYPACKMDVFNTAKKFKTIYDNPEKLGFDRDKRTKPLKSDPAFKAPADGAVLAPSLKHMFFDDVHPTAQAHYILSRKVYKYVNKHYNVVDPTTYDKKQKEKELKLDECDLIKIFRDKHKSIFHKDLLGFFGEFRSSRINVDTPYLRLIDIFDHAINNGGKRTYSVLQKLGWLDQEGKLYLDNVPALKHAYERATAPKLAHCL